MTGALHCHHRVTILSCSSLVLADPGYRGNWTLNKCRYTARYLAAAQCIVICPVCGFVCLQRAGGVRTLLQPARAQYLRLSERFFIVVVVVASAK